MAERKTSPRLPLIISFVLFLGVVLGTFIVQLGAAQDGLDRWVGHEDHRLPNIRQVPKSCRWAVIDRFIDLQPVQDADAIVFGDSQVYSRGARLDQMFYTHWLGADAIVINFSYFGGPLNEMNAIANELARRGTSVKRTFVTLNISHFARRDRPWLKNKNNPLGYRQLLPERPIGFKKLLSNRVICAFRLRRTFAKDDLRTPRYRTLRDDFKEVPIPDFFVSFEPEYFDNIAPLYLDGFPKITRSPIIVTSPIARDKLGVYDFEADNLVLFENSFETLCEVVSPPFQCLNLLQSMTSEGFIDFIHLNPRGHELIGERLKETFELPN